MAYERSHNKEATAHGGDSGAVLSAHLLCPFYKEPSARSEQLGGESCKPTRRVGTRPNVVVLSPLLLEAKGKKQHVRKGAAKQISAGEGHTTSDSDDRSHRHSLANRIFLLGVIEATRNTLTD